MKEFDNGLQNKFDFDFSAPEDLKIDLKKLNNFLEKGDTLIFYGGEPLVKIKKIIEIMDSIPKDKEIRFYMQTNGKLLNELPEKYLKKFPKILISIDGDKKRTDLNRGKGTYDLVLKNVKKIRKNFKGEIVARMTIESDVGADIFKQVKYLINLKLFDSIHWQLDAGFYKNDFNEKEFSNFVNEYNREIKKLIDFWVEEMKNGNVLKIYPFLGIFESLYYETKTKLRCGSGYANYTITTNGIITACPIMNNIKNFYCGDLNSKHENLKKIEISSPCTKCKYFDICGGRCLYSNYAKLWPEQGQYLVCKTIIFLIESLKEKIPDIKKLINKKTISEKDFNYEKYFGPEIIP